MLIVSYFVHLHLAYSQSLRHINISKYVIVEIINANIVNLYTGKNNLIRSHILIFAPF